MPHKPTSTRKSKPSIKNTSPDSSASVAMDDPAEGSLLEIEHSLEKLKPKTQNPRRSK